MQGLFPQQDTPIWQDEDTERLLETFLAMVRIDSPSGDEGAMRAYLEARLAAWGVPCRTDAGGNLIAELPACDAAHDEVLVLSGHMDVVPPCLGVQPVVTGTGDERFIASDNTTVLGADDKAGLAVMLEALAVSRARGLARPAIRLVFTTREETSLGGAKELDDAALKAGFALVFDHTGPQGTIITGAPTYLDLTFAFQGKSVHAGIMPERGVSAIVLAGRVIDRLTGEGLLGRIDSDTTANLGFIEGGKATNIVPDHVSVRGELRGHDPERLEAVVSRMRAILDEETAAMAGAAATLVVTEAFRAYAMPDEHPGVLCVAEAARATGLEPRRVRTNGGSDNNVFVHRGLPGVVLSAGYVDPHSLKECVRLSEMRLCAAFLLNALAGFAARRFACPVSVCPP